MRLSFIALLFWSFYSFGQSDTTIYIKEFGWTLKAPSTFKFMDSATISEGAKNGTKEIEKVTDNNVDNSGDKVLFSATTDGAFFAAISAPITSEDFDLNDSLVKNAALKSFADITQDSMPSTSSYLLEIISGITFKKMSAIFKLAGTGQTLDLNILSAYYKKQYFQLLYYSMDKQKSKVIENMLATSKFEK